MIVCGRLTCGGLGLMFLLAGCTAKPSIPMARVSGVVTWNNEPVERGTIDFAPVGGKTPTAAAEIKNGRYSAAVPLGRMKVKISSLKVVGQTKGLDTPGSPLADVTEERLPAIYNTRSTLEAEVTKDRADCHFDLKPADPPARTGPSKKT